MTTLQAQLAAHRPHDADEARHLATIRTFLDATAAPFSRATIVGHVTGSAVVVDERARALLLHHARLGLWVQPGGHMDEDETDPATTALREAREETGLPDLVLTACHRASLLLDVDVHPIPESVKRGEPAHLHHDVCYLARTRRPDEARIDPDESRAMRWVTVHELDSLPLDTATRRRLLKAFSRAGV